MIRRTIAWREGGLRRLPFFVPVLAVVSFFVSLAAQSSAPIMVTSVTATPVSTAPVGASVTFTVAATGGISPLQYKFWLYNRDTSSWVLLRDYGTASNTTWVPSVPGLYHVQVWVRSAGSIATWEAWANSAVYTVTPTALTVTSVAAAPASPAPAGTVVTFTAAGTGGVSPLQYKFWIYNRDTSTWGLLRDYGPESSVTWMSAPGLYHVQVWARSAGSAATWEAWANSAAYSVTAPAGLTVTSVTATPASTAPAGTSVTFTATAAGGVSPLQYQFWLYNRGTGSWTLLRDYGSSSTATWIPSAPALYHVQVWVRSAGSAATWEAWANSAVYAVTAPTDLTVTSVTFTPQSPVAVGTPVTWTAQASGGLAPLQYKFSLYNRGTSTWTLLRDYGSDSSATSALLAPGLYHVQVWVRSAGSAAEFEAWQNSPPVEAFQMGPPQWTTVVTRGSEHTVNWSAATGALRYRVYQASSPQALGGVIPSGPFTEVTVSPLRVGASSAPAYFRVFGVAGNQVGPGGPIAVSTTLTPIDVGIRSVTPALWDVDGDGCLDAVGARGTCGGFEPYPLDEVGLEGLFASGRVNRDSRFADFNGDGHVDIFTNVYALATSTASRAILHINDGTGRFTEDPGIQAMQIGGFGETVLAADFDNDGDVDIFLPNYTHRSDGGHNWLLINDGAGHFTDVSASAGVASNAPHIPEGAQTIDINQDGWIDIHVASHLYINNGNLTFTDRAAEVGLPARFDEGMRLFDVDLDGDFDLVHHDSFLTRLYRAVQSVFDAGMDVNGSATQTTFGFGLNVCDINGDGFEDVLVANNDSTTRVGAPRLLLNVGGSLMPSDFVTAGAAYNDLMACADLDGSGLPDVLARWGGYRSLVNRAGSDATIRLRIVGSAGERNQQGRVVRIRPSMWPDRTMMRVVESGSGYMAQNGYDLLVAAPWAGAYEVAVRFGGGWFQTTARPGDELTIYSDGSVVEGLR